MFLTPESNYKRTIMPPQKISAKQKNEEWQKQCVDYVIGVSATANPFSNNPFRIRNIQTNIDIYEGNFDEEELKYITNPFNVEDGMPARLKEYNIVRPIVDSLLGEEVNRPFDFVVYRTSQNAASELQDIIKDKLTNYAYAAIKSNLSPENAKEYDAQLQSGQIQPPEEIQRWSKESYKDIAEIFVQTLLDYETNKLEVKTEFVKGWKDLIVNREEIYFVGEEYGHPNARRVNPSTFCYEFTPGMTYIDDATWTSERMILSYAEVHDLFGDDLPDDDMDKILERITGKGNGSHTAFDKDPYQMDGYHENRFELSNQQFPFNVMSQDTIEVWKVHWKSFRKVFFITLNNEQNNHPETFVVDESYTMTGKEEEVQEDWIMQVWQGYKCQGDIYFGIRPINVATDSDDPTTVKMPYTGLCAVGKSIVELLKPIQITYLSLWYRLELLLARDNGRALVMDITQIPKSLGIDTVRWAHMLKSLGVIMVNPYENGWNIPGRDGSRASSFNGFTAVDLSMAQSITMYIQLIDKCEQMAQQIVGFNPQRMGQVGNRDLKSTTQEALNQSYNTSALLVYQHDMCKQRVMRKLMNTALAIRYRDNDKFLSYIGEDGMRMFMDMPQSALEPMDLFVKSSGDQIEKINQLKQLYQPAMQNGASLSDIVEIMSMNNLTAIKLKLKEIESKKEQQMQAQQQQEQAIKEAEMQQVKEDKEHEIDKENADRMLEKYRVDLENQTRIEVATINTYIKQQELDQNNNGIPDPMELQQMDLDRQQAMMDQESTMRGHDISEMQHQHQVEKDMMEAANKAKEIDIKRRIELKKLELEEERLKQEAKLAREANDLQEDIAEDSNETSVEVAHIGARARKTASSSSK